MTAMALVASASHGQLIVGVDAPGVPLRLWDAASGQYLATLAKGNVAVRGLAADDGGRTLYLSNGPQLWAIPYDGPLGPRLVGAYSGAVTGVSGDLAFDPVRRELLGTGGPGSQRLVRINPATAATTLVRNFMAGDLGGLAFEAARDRLLLATDSDLGDGAGPGVYALGHPYTAAPERIADYPDKAPMIRETDVDALAIAGETLWLVCDEPEWMYALNLVEQRYAPPTRQVFLTAAHPSGGATWAAGLWPDDRADLRVTLTAEPNPQPIVPGGAIDLTVRVTNLGPSALGVGSPVRLTVPAQAAWAFATPPATPVNGVAEWLTGPLAAGAEWTATARVLTTAAGTLVYVASAAPPPGVFEAAPSDNAASVAVRAEPLVDLRVTLDGPPACATAPGQVVEFRARVNNAWPTTAPDVTWQATWSAGAMLVSADPPLSGAGDGGTAALGALEGGGARELRVRLARAAPGPIELTVRAASPWPALTPEHAGATRSARVLSDTTPTGPGRVARLSTLAASPTSLLPGGLEPPPRLVAPLGPPSASPSGTWWIVRALTDRPEGERVALVVGGPSGVGLGLLQSFTELPIEPGPSGWFGPRVAAQIDEGLGIDDAGRWVFSGRDGRAEQEDDQFAMRWDGLSFVPLFQESITPADAIGPGVRFGGLNAPIRVGLHGDGRAACVVSVAGPGVDASNNRAVLCEDLTTVALREGLATPAGARDSTGAPAEPVLRELRDARVGGPGPSVLADARLALSGLDPPTSGVDEALAVFRAPGDRGEVVVQENLSIPRLASPLTARDQTPWTHADVDSGGRWLAHGRWNGGAGWTMRDGALLAASGAPIVSGGAERWAANAAFLGLAGNRAGDVVVVGPTDHPDPLRAQAAVLNGREVILRANDPVDLDDNGAYDDGVFVASFSPDALALSEGRLLIVVRLRDQPAAVGCAPDVTLGEALLSLPVPRPCAPDYDRDGQLTQEDLIGFLTAFLSEEPTPGPGGFATPCSLLAPPFDAGFVTDFNGDCAADQEDLLPFLTAFFAGCDS